MPTTCESDISTTLLVACRHCRYPRHTYSGLQAAPLAHDDERHLHIDRLQQQLLCFVVYTFSFTAFGHKYELKYNVAICYTTLCLLFVYCLFVGVFFLQGTLLSRASIPRHHDLGMARLCQQYSLALVRWHNRQDSTLSYRENMRRDVEQWAVEYL